MLSDDYYSGGETTVTVIVHRGKEGEADEDDSACGSFQIHKTHLCHYSPFFDAALNGNFIESKTQEVELYETDPKIFGILTNWLYTQDITNEHGDTPGEVSRILLWIMADRLLVAPLQNHILCLLGSHTFIVKATRKAERAHLQMLSHIYENTTSDSHLRRFIEFVISISNREMTDTEYYPRQLLVAIVNGMRKQRRANRTKEQRLQEQNMEAFYVDEEEDIIHSDKRRRIGDK